jgi:Lrp/AsnC family transcriptional regulator for asnA, asnC and gidA
MKSTESLSTSNHLDSIDLQIIAALQENGRESFSQIAERLNVSAGMVRIRYNRLVDMGILRVIAVTNPLRTGYNMTALIALRVDGDRLMDVGNQIAALEEVIYLTVVSGAYNLMLEVVCRNHDHLFEFLTGRLNKIAGIRESETFIYLKILKEIYF